MSFIPLHLSAIKRSPTLKPWLLTWLPKETVFLSPQDWFIRGHDITGGTKNEDGIWIPQTQPGTYVWNLPPAAAEIALEEL